MTEKLKVIVDTNVFISALIGKSRTFIALYESFLSNEFTPVFSLETLAELKNVLDRPGFRAYFSRESAKTFRSFVEKDALIIPATEGISLCRDPKDNIILEAAVAGDADFIVSGDKDLLIIKKIKNIPIITPREFVSKLRSK